MAKNNDKDDTEEQEEATSKKGMSTMKIVILAVVVSVLFGGGLVGGTVYFMGGGSSDKKHEVTATDENTEEEDAKPEHEAEDDDSPPQYESLDPKFVVSFNDQRQARFMQFSVQVMTRKEDVIKDIKTHMPAIRSSLLMLVGSQTFEKVSTREGKEQLLADITADINTTLEKMNATPGIEASFFDSFVIQ